jgi:hypothetical protein
LNESFSYCGIIQGPPVALKFDRDTVFGMAIITCRGESIKVLHMLQNSCLFVVTVANPLANFPKDMSHPQQIALWSAVFLQRFFNISV